MTKTVLYTAYTAADIDKMRELCTWKALLDRFDPPTPDRMRYGARFYNMDVDHSIVEAMVQTYILAGLFPHDLVDPQ